MASGPTRWERLQGVFADAASMPADDRLAYLDAVCGADPSLRAEVEAMLAANSPEFALGIERLVNDDASAPPGTNASVPPEVDPLVGFRLGAWRVRQCIGRGGMGTVYLAERADGLYEQRVALKVVGANASSHAAALFEAERRILARLAHPHIARLLDAGFTPEGSAFMAMELVDGAPITAHCDSRRLSVEERLRLFLVVCRATQHAHQALVVHRDLKPSNIFVSREGDVKLLDFGVAKLLEPEPAGPAPVTRDHRAVTLGYAAPEQLRGEPVTTATDVYALGVVLYELLVGHRPFSASETSPLEVERLITSTDPLAPSQAARRMTDAASAVAAAARATTGARLARRLRGDLDRIVLEALRTEPHRRYASAGQFADDIERYLSGHPVRAQPDAVAYRARRFVGRHRLAVAAASGFVILLAALALVMGLQARRIAIERDRARVEQGRAEQVIALLVDLFQSSNPDVVPGGDRLGIGAFLERAETRALGELAEQPELASRMRHVLGLVHHARSNYPHARELLETALEAQRGLTGRDSRAALEIQVDLARLLAWIDQRDAARELLEDGIARIERTLGRDDPLVARGVFVLAEVAGDPARVRGYLERAASIGRLRLASNDRERIRYISSLAVEHLRAHQLSESRALFLEALAGAERLNGGRSTTMIGVLNDSASLDGATGDFAAAETKHRRALALATDLIGSDSFQVANAMNNLAVALASQGRIEESAEAFRQTYDRHVALFGPDHWRTTNTMRNIGMAMLLLDRPQECEWWMSRAAKASHPRNLRSASYMQAQLARCLLRSGRTDAGIALLEPALAALDADGPDAAHYAANVRLWLGRALLDTSRLERAEPLVRAAVDYQRRTRAVDHPVRAEAECELAHVVAARGALEEARSLAEGCVPRIARHGQMEPWRRAEAERLLERLRTAKGS